MPLVYCDSSALVKLLVDEEGNELAVQLWDGCDAALSSRLAYPEVRSALAAASRDHDLAEAEATNAAEQWEELWHSVRPVELTATSTLQAGRLAELHALRGADAVHLASALALSEADPIVAVWDRRLHAACGAEGLEVAPRQLSR